MYDIYMNGGTVCLVKKDPINAEGPWELVGVLRETPLEAALEMRDALNSSKIEGE